MQQLTLPGIEFAPGKVRRHGLREFHTYPLVSPGKDAAGVWGGAFRVPAAQAWTFPELELGRTGNSIPALLFDLDGDPTDWLVDVLGPALPRPNWIVWRRENMHAHVAYTLARAVLTGEQAKRTPQAYLARVGEYMAAELKADAAYSAVLGHNPISQASHGRYTTDWMREEPYSLAELVAFMPKGWRRPILQPQTIYGRNDALFKAGMKWSGEPRNWGNWAGLASSLWVKNQGFIAPLGERELGGIVKSVVRYQRRNLESGKQQQTFSSIQAARGKKSGAARRTKTADRDAAIIQAVQHGESIHGVAREYGLNRYAIRHILKRGGNEPKQDDVPPASRFSQRQASVCPVPAKSWALRD